MLRASGPRRIANVVRAEVGKLPDFMDDVDAVINQDGTGHMSGFPGTFAALERTTPIVQVDGGVATTTSMRIANGTENEHASVLRLIRDNLSDFEGFGLVGFEIAPFDTAGGPTAPMAWERG